ncbi:DNA replication/repair protein RecF [Entomobacter blattae]|uniref:DNA replication and repair protein RecF n=1 Tax=Entomobacter blattae TaxID=2762277 RepID=A0A7H1NT36_9PROT|nr:DNA replication/repair protein RecF [Entomobacter blattae]QNT78946.1 DNA replication and repair protein RecF [Entomobacter blattae]
MQKVLQLTISDFRNYTSLKWASSEHIIILTGANGSGKTNFLEAISLLAPGKGLRQAAPEMLLRKGASRWGVYAKIQVDSDSFTVSTGNHIANLGRGRLFQLNGEPVKNRQLLAQHVTAVWITPKMDQLFSEGASGRRQFFDRLILSYNPFHGQEIIAHNHSVKQRNTFFLQNRKDEDWLTALEYSIARHAVAIAASRRQFCHMLNRSQFSTESGFPEIHLDLLCPIAEKLDYFPAVEVENWLKEALKNKRGEDLQMGSTSYGAHKADFSLSDRITGRLASISSTGQQKTLLLGLVMLHAQLIHKIEGKAPILLLDEPLVHLDSQFREKILSVIGSYPSSVFLTGNDKEPFFPLKGHASFFNIEDGFLRESERKLTNG